MTLPREMALSPALALTQGVILLLSRSLASLAKPRRGVGMGKAPIAPAAIGVDSDRPGMPQAPGVQRSKLLLLPALARRQSHLHEQKAQRKSQGELKGKAKERYVYLIA